MSAAEQTCYLYVSPSSSSESFNEVQLRTWLEKGDTDKKIHALKQVIHLILNGEKLPSILMTIIRYVMHIQDHTIKKLLLIFWEIVPKVADDGALVPEMILVCDAFRQDLLHPNEYIRGSTLRFLCKIKEVELLEPLISAIRFCLGHHHPYVRRNAILAVCTIYKNFNYLVPDAAELITSLLETERDISCKRIAFIMLTHVNQEKALAYLNTCIDQVHVFGTSLQLVIVELLHKVCVSNPSRHVSLFSCICNLLNSRYPAVKYEAAKTLAIMSSTPAAIRAAINCYIDVIAESDNNVKLIVLDHIIALKESIGPVRVLQDLVMDILGVLTVSDVEVCRKVINLAQDLVSSSNVENVVVFFKKEIIKTKCEFINTYRQLLVRAVHSCCIKFPGTARVVISTFIELLLDSDDEVSADIMAFIKEAMQWLECFRPVILNKLLEVISSIRSSVVHRSILWMLGEYCCTITDIQRSMRELSWCLGNVPIVDELKKAIDNEGKLVDSPEILVMADGTYATQSVFSVDFSSEVKHKTPLQDYLMAGDYFTGAVLSSALIKLTLKYINLEPNLKKQNTFASKSMLIMASIIHLGKSGLSSTGINDDDFDRIALCLKVLADRCPLAMKIFGAECHKPLTATENVGLANEVENQNAKGNAIRVDDPITFVQLTITSEETENVFDASLPQVVGMGGDTDLVSKLGTVTQLTSISDPVYAEAYVKVNQDSIILDVFIVNQTCDTLQDCTLELAASRSVNIIEKPSSFVIAPLGMLNLKASAKVTSAVNAAIYGNITYNVSQSINVFALNDICIDIRSYIVPKACSDQEFQSMWKEFHWEKKVSVHTHLLDPNEYLIFLIARTNMKCLTPQKLIPGGGIFLAANLHACSIFGESVLANVCIGKNSLMPDDPLTGFVRFRAKTKDLVLDICDKISENL